MDKLPKEILLEIIYMQIKKSPSSVPLFRLVCKKWNKCMDHIECSSSQRITYYNMSAYYGYDHLLRFYYKLWYSNYNKNQKQILLNKALRYAASSGSACIRLLIKLGANNLDEATAIASRFKIINLHKISDYLIDAGANSCWLSPAYLQCRNRCIRKSNYLTLLP